MKKFLAVAILLILPISIVYAYEAVKPCCKAKANATKYKAVIFDCDGIIVDSEYLKFQAWRKILNKYKVDFALNEYTPLVGSSSKEILSAIKANKNLVLKVSDEELIKQKNALYKKIQAKQVKTNPKAIKFIKKLTLNKNKLGIKLGVASSGGISEIKVNLAKAKLNNTFDAVISGRDDLLDIKDESGINKPKPYIYARIAEWLGVKPSECLVIEDSEAGVNAAHAAGMTVYAFPNRYTKGQDFSNANLVIADWDKVELTNTSSS